MKRHFCFLRAINVGGHTVTMQALKKLFEDMGFSRVETFIASGNVIFETSKKDPRAVGKLIFERLRDALGYEVHAFVRTDEELKAIGDFKPFPATSMKNAVSYHIGFGDHQTTPEIGKKVASCSTDTDDIRSDRSEIYWVARTRFSDSKVSGASIERSLGSRATFRNVNTVKRLLARYPPHEKG